MWVSVCACFFMCEWTFKFWRNSIRMEDKFMKYIQIYEIYTNLYIILKYLFSFPSLFLYFLSIYLSIFPSLLFIYIFSLSFLSHFMRGFTSTDIYIYIDIHIYVVPSISFQTFFVQAFKIVVDSWKLTMLLLYILWDDWPIFMISASNEQLQ